MCPCKKKMNEIIIDADSSDSEMYTSTDTSIYDYDSDENDTSTQIYEEDSEFLESDKENNKYYWKNGTELSYFIENESLVKFIIENIKNSNNLILNPCKSIL
jgi:hypothetical protein